MSDCSSEDGMYDIVCVPDAESQSAYRLYDRCVDRSPEDARNLARAVPDVILLRDQRVASSGALGRRLRIAPAAENRVVQIGRVAGRHEQPGLIVAHQLRNT